MADTPRVLIIEDQDVLRAMLFTVLRHQPLGVDAASCAEDALAKVTACDYALVLIDMDLANGSAPEFLRRFRDERPEATTFVIAARNPKKDTFIDPQIVSAVLNKPLELDTLAEVVRECAIVVPPPEEPLTCPPAENDVKTLFDRSSLVSN